MSERTLYQFGASPNSIRIRLALKLKNLDCDVVDCDPMDRSNVLEVSGQPLTAAWVKRVLGLESQ